MFNMTPKEEFWAYCEKLDYQCLPAFRLDDYTLNGTFHLSIHERDFYYFPDCDYQMTSDMITKEISEHVKRPLTPHFGLWNKR